MQAAKFIGSGHPARLEHISEAKLGPDQVVIRIGDAAVCHSDLDLTGGDLGCRGEFTLGHQNAGWVAEPAPGTTRFKKDMDRADADNAVPVNSRSAVAITTSTAAARPIAVP